MKRIRIELLESEELLPKSEFRVNEKFYIIDEKEFEFSKPYHVTEFFAMLDLLCTLNRFSDPIHPSDQMKHEPVKNIQK